MGIYEKVRQEAKIDSRRFGKSIVCEILRGQDLDFISLLDMPEKGAYYHRETGIDTVRYKVFVMPITKYEQYKKIDVTAGLERKDRADQKAKQEEQNKEASILIKEAINRKLAFLKQNIVHVQMDHKDIEGRKCGLPPDKYGVLIDSIDVNQCVFGVYTPKTALNIRQPRSLRD